MVADTDNSGPKDDGSQPEVAGDPLAGEEFFTPEESTTQHLEPEGMDIPPPQSSSVGRKIVTAIGITIVAVAVSMYLTHKQKVKEAAQMEVTPPSKMASLAPPETSPTNGTVTPKSLESKPGIDTTAPKPLKSKPMIDTAASKPLEAKPIDQKVEKAPKADNASLAAAISKSVSTSEPTKKESPLTAEISKSVSTTVEETPKAVSTTVETASKTVSETPETTSKNLSTTSETITKKESNTSATSMPESAPPEATPAKLPESATVTVTTESPKIMGRIDGLDAKTNDISTRLDSIDKALVVLNKTVDSMEKKLTAPVVVAQMTKNPMSPMMMPIAIKQPAHRRVVYRERRMKVYHEQMMPVRQVRTGLYVIRAIVPGRAWVEGAMGGGAFTVMEGDRIPGTGIVSKVDAENGEVTMDTGEVIKYGTDDH